MGVDSNYLILFRGDTRPPEEVFAKGFESKDPTAEIRGAIGKETKEMQMGVAVCLTPIFDVAVNFPTGITPEERGIAYQRLQSSGVTEARDYPKITYVYMTRVPKERIYFTYLDQIRYNHTGLAYAQEVAVKRITPDEIIGAIGVKRFFYGLLISNFIYPCLNAGGEYKLLQKSITYNNLIKTQSWFNPIQAKLDTLILNRINGAVIIPISTNAVQEEISTLDSQPTPKMVSFDKHKINKRLTFASVFLQGILPSFPKMLEKARRKAAGNQDTEFPVVKAYPGHDDQNPVYIPTTITLRKYLYQINPSSICFQSFVRSLEPF